MVLHKKSKLCRIRHQKTTNFVLYGQNSHFSLETNQKLINKILLKVNHIPKMVIILSFQSVVFSNSVAIWNVSSSKSLIGRQCSVVKNTD